MKGYEQFEQILTAENLDCFLGGGSKEDYVRTLSFEPFSWQAALLNSTGRRIIINAARQSGKSTITSADPCWTAKYEPDSLSIVLAPTESQSQDDMEKINRMIQEHVTDLNEIAREYQTAEGRRMIEYRYSPAE